MTPLRLGMAVLMVLWLAGTGATSADEVQVNTYTTGDQDFPAVAVGVDGTTLVVWDSEGSSGTDTSDESVQGQLFASDGSTRGGEFQVNTYTTGMQRTPSAAVATDGSFIVVWSSSGSSGSDSRSSSIQGQRYASSGAPIGAEFQVNTATTSNQDNPVVGILLDNDFVVAWDSFADYGPFDDIRLQRFASDGSFLGTEFVVNTYTRYYQIAPSLAVAPNGDFVVVWGSEGSNGTDTSLYSVQGQRFASNGSFIGTEFQVNTYTTGYQRTPSVDMDDSGDFVVVWHSYDFYYALQYEIRGQRFSSNGSAVGDEFQINSYTSSTPYGASVAVAGEGHFVVLWQSYGSPGNDGSLSSAQARRFASDGTAIGDQFQVNTYTQESQNHGAVAFDAVGQEIAVWSSRGSDGSDSLGRSVQKKVLPLFADGFESGDASAWTNVNP